MSSGIVLLMLMIGSSRGEEVKSPRTRSFLLTYQGQVNGLAAGQAADIWIPVPPGNRYQTVKEVSRKLGAKAQTGQEERFGNRILHFKPQADKDGQISFEIVYQVTRKEVRLDLQRAAIETDVAADQEDDLFLRPDTNVPVGGKPMALLKGKTLPEDQLQLARVLYDVVNKHMTYAKDTPGWGRGDANWACDSGRGNCSDFHSLFISLARGNHIPAKFEIGFPLPPKRGKGTISGYHCWGWFKPVEHGWIPVDISEANRDPSMVDYYFGNLTENRAVFSVGRDLVLVPQQAGPPVNFFVNPYVEVDRKPWPSSQIRCWCDYRDTDADADQT